jgi:pimeloyl-ACP methyl ester carboxylesterase
MAKTEWADRLGEFFSNYTLEWVPNTGHFVQYERPDLFNAEAIQYFASFSRTSGTGGR